MRADTLDLLRCPFCGGSLGLVEAHATRRGNDEIVDGILGCYCCSFPIVAGIPVMHLETAAVRARELVEADRPDLAMREMIGLDGAGAERFEAVAASPAATYRDLVEALGPNFEGGYFLYRFSDPTYVVADAVVRAVVPAVLRDGGRAIDVCGGSGHLTRSLSSASSGPPVLADLYFSKLWLAQRFTAPDCEVVCCDGNAALPFARGAFRFAVCSDAFHYIWTKRLLASEMMRLVDLKGAVAVTHAHNATRWNPSGGMPLPHAAYQELFEEMGARVFSEAGLLGDIAGRDCLDLGRLDAAHDLDADPALTIVASAADGVFREHAVQVDRVAQGEFRINPLYAVRRDGDRVRLELGFPSSDYEEEYRAARLYLPTEVVLEHADLEAFPAKALPERFLDLARRRVILDLPRRYC